MKSLLKWFPSRKRKDEQRAMQRAGELAPLGNMFSEMDRMFERVLREPFGALTANWQNTLASEVNVEDKEKELKVTVKLPGLEPNDVNVHLQDNTLTISGERKTEKTKDKNFSAWSYSSFQRVVPLPTEVESENIKAKFKKGVLTIRLPKAQPNELPARKIPVLDGA